MDRPAFDHAWLHANAIAELTFLRSLARAFVALQAPASGQVRADLAELGQRVADLDEHNFDWSALEGVEGFGVPAQPGSTASDAGPPPTVDLAGVPAFGDAVDFDGDPEQGAPDIDRYLGCVAAARSVLEPRIADAHARADHAALDAALAPLAADEPGLGEPLDAAGLTGWIERYEREDPALVAVIEALRRFEPGLDGP
jgi:hypothetical protein